MASGYPPRERGKNIFGCSLLPSLGITVSYYRFLDSLDWEYEDSRQYYRYLHLCRIFAHAYSASHHQIQEQATVTSYQPTVPVQPSKVWCRGGGVRLSGACGGRGGARGGFGGANGSGRPDGADRHAGPERIEPVRARALPPCRGDRGGSRCTTVRTQGRTP